MKPSCVILGGGGHTRVLVDSLQRGDAVHVRVNAGAELGVNVIINSGAIVEHDCRLGHHVHVATGARLSGTVRVGDRAHVGAGAVIRQSITVAEDAVVGAESVVVTDVGPGQVVVGNPARLLVSQPRQRPHRSRP